MMSEINAASPVLDAGEVRPKAANANLYLHPSGSGSLRLGSFSGVLKASTGTVSAGTVDLASEITGILPIANGGTGSSAKNFVDLTTTQSVAGLKTFSDQVNVNDPLLMDHTTSTEPASGKCAFYPKSDGKFYKFCNGGSETEIGSSGDYTFAGSSYLPATTNCTPTIATGGVLSAFGTDADCPAMTIEYSELGTWSTADQNKFSQVITDLPAGTYRACVEFITSINGSEVMGVAINDGTTSSPTVGYGGYASGNQFGARRCAIFRYASAGTRTFQPYVISGGSTITHQNAGSFASYFTLERIKP